MRPSIVAATLVVALTAAACTSSTGAGGNDSVPAPDAGGTSPPQTTSVTSPPETRAATTASTSAPTTSPPETSTTTTSTTTTSTTTTSTTTTTTTVSTTTPYAVPLVDVQAGGWSDTHANYPATDIFENGCGNGIVSPVNGSLLEVRRINSYDSNVDNPATRGGRSIAILGDDGVRYYLAHLELVEEALAVGQRIAVGQTLGTIGTTGRSSACHVHFGISPPCPDQEWSVRRGAIWPYRYLDDWKAGGQLSPVDEVASWVAANPDACADASADPFAPDA